MNIGCKTDCFYWLLFFLIASLPAGLAAKEVVSRLPVKVAAVGPLTPSSKAFGIAHLQGITLAAEEYNEEHKAGGRSIELQVFDDQADPKIGAGIVESIAGSDAVAILGPANSSVSAAVIERVQERHLAIAILTSLSTASNLTKGIQTPYFLRANVSDQKRLATLLGLIFGGDNTRARRILALYERGDTFGEGMLNDAKNWLQSNNSGFLSTKACTHKL